MANRKGRSVEASTKVKGGYYKLPKAKNPHGLSRYGHQGSGLAGDAYHNAHYMRSGTYGHNDRAKTYAKSLNRSTKALGGSVAALGAAHVLLGSHTAGRAVGSVGYHAASGLHKVGAEHAAWHVASGTAKAASHAITSHPKASLVATGVAGGLAAYSIHKSHQAQKQVDWDTHTKPSAFGGFYHPNQRNAKTGVRASTTVGTRTLGRVGKKSY